MSIDEVPSVIRSVMEHLGMNDAEPALHDGVMYYNLGRVGKDGFALPTGLPIIYKVTEKGAEQVDAHEYYQKYYRE